MNEVRISLRDFLTTQTRRYEKRVFLEYQDQRISYREFDDRTDRVATALDRAGLRPGDRIAFLLSNRPEFLYYFFGAPKIGIIPVPIHPQLSMDRMVEAIWRVGAKVIISEMHFAETARQLLSRLPEPRDCMFVDGEAFDGVSFRRTKPEKVLGFWPDLDSNETAAIVLTRGSTGAPKPVCLSHSNLLAGCAMLHHPLRMRPEDRVLCTLPFAQIEALVDQVLAALGAGATCILRDDVNALALGRDLCEQNISVVAGDPIFYRALASVGSFPEHESPALRLALCTAGTLEPSYLQKFEERFEALIVNTYGLAETSGICCANPYTGLRKPLSIGMPLPGVEVRLVDESLAEVCCGTVGELVVRAPCVMRGYYDDAHETGQAIQDHWLRTGDLASMDDDGYYFFAGRKSDAGS